MEKPNTSLYQKKIPGITFTRSMCAIGIIIYHYSCHTQNGAKILYTTQSGSWGVILVTAFFIISGMVMYHNYENIPSLREFYYKRWKSIYPAFYLCFAYYFLQNVFYAKKLFYGPHPATLLLTLLGMDGYFLYMIPNYYIVGEWFLGAIIILYLLYPLILWLMKKTDARLIFVLLLVTELLVSNAPFLKVSPTRSQVTCLFSFYIGIMLRKYSGFFSKKIFLFISLAVFSVMYFFPVSFPLINAGNVIVNQIQGLTLFCILMHAGKVVMNYSVPRKVFDEIGKISYPIYLLQHNIVMKVLGSFDPHNVLKEILLIAITIMLTVIYAKVVSVVVKSVLNSHIFQKAESRILKNNT